MYETTKSLYAETNFIGVKEDPDKYLQPIRNKPQQRPFVQSFVHQEPIVDPKREPQSRQQEYIPQTYSKTIVDLPILTPP